MSDSIDKLLADYCAKFIKTGELDETMLREMQAYADQHRGEFEPPYPPRRSNRWVRARAKRITPAPVAETLRDWLRAHPVKPQRKRMGPGIPRITALKADWDHFAAEIGIARGVQKTPDFIGPRFPRGYVNKLFAAWRKSCRNSCPSTPVSLDSSEPTKSPTPERRLLESSESAAT